MRIPHSDIFDAYAEKMEGLIKSAQEKDSKELKKYKTDPHPRVGSDTKEVIEKLYNTNPEPIKGMEYGGKTGPINILDLAHPRPVVIAPSYDPLNGLVENENERANIIRNILTQKLPSGTIMMTRYARQALTMELIRVANDLDNAGQEDLRVLADQCLEHLTKQALDTETLLHDVEGVGKGMGAGAGIGAVLGGIIGAFGGPGGFVSGALVGGTLGGVLSALGKTTPQVQNIQLNGKRVLEELGDLEHDVPEQQSFFNQLEASVNGLVSNAAAYQDALDSLKMRELSEHPEASPVKDDDTVGLAKSLSSQISKIKLLTAEFRRRATAGEFAKASHSSLNPIYWFKDDSIESIEGSLQALGVAMDKLSGTMVAIGEKATDQAKDQTPSDNAGANTPKRPAVPMSGGRAAKDIEALRALMSSK